MSKKNSLLKKSSFITLFLTLGVFSVFFTGELAFWGAYKISKHHLLDIYKKNTDYPTSPDDYIKISIFGGSAARGYNSEKNFPDILKYELEKNFPDKKFYFKTFASNGAPFYKNQAELIKQNIEKFDYFLISSGNNEIVNYWGNNAFFTHPDFKARKIEERLKTGIPKSKKTSKIISYLHAKSHFFSFANRVLDKLNAIYRKKQNKKKINNINSWIKIVYPRFTSKHMMSPAQKTKLYDNFKYALEEVAILSDKKSKKIIVSSVMDNEEWLPAFSIVEKLNIPAVKQLDLKAQNALKNKKYILLEIIANQALKSADKPIAVFQYYKGMSLLGKGDQTNGRQWLRKAITNDPYFIRSTDKHHNISLEMSSKYKSVRYIDVIEEFHIVLNQGVSYSSLFVDPHHPSVVGHVINAYNFYCTIATDIDKNAKCHSLENFNPTAIYKKYKKELNITSDITAKDALMVARWHIGMQHQITAYPEQYISEAIKYLQKFLKNAEPTSRNRVQYNIFLALTKSTRERERVLKLLNESFQISRSEVERLIYKRLNTNNIILNAIKDYQIDYSPEKGFIILD
jgi:hypothetical protein